MLNDIQIEQMMSEVVDSDADFVIAGGDFNATPNDETGMN
jgi:hypothetical protein